MARPRPAAPPYTIGHGLETLEGDGLAKKRQPAKKPVDEDKLAEKRARREARKVAEAKATQQATRKRRLRNVLVVAFGVVAITAIGVLLFPRLVPPELPGVAKPGNEGRGHVASGQTATYATATPTSGPHNPGAPRCGVYAQQLPPDLAVHALEHGAVVIWHQPGLADDDVAELQATVERFDDGVILSPNGQLDQPVVATAWNRFKAYNGADPEIEEFIATYRSRGPERVSCPL